MQAEPTPRERPAGLCRGPFGRAHLMFLAVVGAAGWLLLGWGLWTQGWPVSDSGPVTPISFGLLLIFCLIARFLAFEVASGMAVSLDSAFYIAAIWTLGPLPSALVASFCVLLVDGAWRTFLRGPRPRRHPTSIRILRLFYAAGAVGAQFFLVGLVFPLESVRSYIAASPSTAHWWILSTIPFLTLLFLVFNYGTGAVNLWIQGYTWTEVRDKLLRHGLLAECLQIPLSMAVVLAFDPKSSFHFILLGTTFLLITAVFKRLTQARSSLLRRVKELETLNEVGQAMSSTLELGQLLGKIAQCTLPVLERAASLAIGLWDQKSEGFRVNVFLRGETAPREQTVRAGVGWAAGVAEQKISQLVLDTGDEAVELAPFESAARALVGVPLVVYDESIGFLSVQGSERGAFGPEDLALLEAIGQQAAVAIENARNYELATVDGLTQVYVRRYFDQRLEEEWQRTARYHTQFALILIDLDDFKHLNDRYGHPIGDRVLRETAAIIKGKRRAIDIPARYGGEEFALLLPRASTADATKVAARIRSDIAQYRLRVNGAEVGVTASIGVASYPDCGDVDASEVLRRADLALYEAKAGGKNRVCVYRVEEGERAKVVP